MNKTKYAPQKKYDAANTTGVYIKLNNKTDADILARLGTELNKQGYIKSLIRKDIEGRNKNGNLHHLGTR